MHLLKKWINTEGLPLVAEKFLLAAIGFALVLTHAQITQIIHIIVCTVMLTLCINMLIGAMKDKSYVNKNDRRLLTSIVGIILALLILWHGKSSVYFIAIAWGISSLEGGITELSGAVYHAMNHQKCVYAFIHGTLEVGLALLLVFDPTHKIAEHILILGLEMIVLAFGSSRDAAGDRKAETAE